LRPPLPAGPQAPTRSAVQYIVLGGRVGFPKITYPGSCGARLFGAWAFPQGARRIVDAYNGAGGHATLQAVGPNGQEGHNLATSPDGPAVWTPLVEAFLRTLR
jgi:hypothetical protein